MKHWWVPGCAIGYEHTFGNQAADLMNAVAQNKPDAAEFRRRPEVPARAGCGDGAALEPIAGST